MRHYKIYAPDPAYSGTVGRATFHDGVARITADGMDPELRYFARRGYRVELVEETKVPAEAAPKPAPKPRSGGGKP